MPIEFDVKITANDMYRFNMYHIYQFYRNLFHLGSGAWICSRSGNLWKGRYHVYGALHHIWHCLSFLFSINLENAGGKTDFHVRGTEKYTALYVG